MIDNSIGPGEGGWAAALEVINCLDHEIMPDGRGPGQPGGVFHWRVIGIAHPNTDGDIRRVAERPVVDEIVGRAGLGGGQEGGA